jgi:MGT family glycosyltransferase
LPWATFCPFPLPVRSKDVPPFGPGFNPAHNALGRLRDRIAGPVIYRTLSKALLPMVNEVRGREGLNAFKTTDEIFGAPSLVLYMTAEPFEYPRGDWNENVAMVGPCAWEPPSEEPGWLDEIDKPIVLVSTSSEFQDDAKIVDAAFAAFADQDVFVVATVPARDAAQFTAPANGRVESFVPHGPILDRAVCAVTHGGMGVTQKALARGVPVVVVPHGRDQLEVAQRAVVAKAGVRLAEGKLTPERLRDAVGRARDLRAGAGRVAEGYARTGGARTAADRFEVSTGVRGSARVPSA